MAQWREGSLARALLLGDPRAPSLALAHDAVICGMREVLAAGPPPELVIVELPQVYQARRTDPSDLIQLAVLVGRVMEVARETGAPVALVLPAEWKGQAPKQIVCARAEEALTEEERGRVDPCRGTLRHNVLDAVGMGLARLGRLPGGRWPRSLP